MRDGPLQSKRVVKSVNWSRDLIARRGAPDLIARRGVWSGRRPGRASGKKRAYRPNGTLSPDPRSRREKEVLEHEPLQSNGVVKPDPGSYREKGGRKVADLKNNGILNSDLRPRREKGRQKVPAT